jgi:hypothetical protein
MALAGSAAAGGIGGALGTKAAASVASVALLTAGAVEVNDYYQGASESNRATAVERSATMAMAGPAIRGSDEVVRRHLHHAPPEAPAKPSESPAAGSLEPVVEVPAEPAAPTETEVPDAVAGGAETGTGLADSGPTYEPEPGPPPVVEEPPVTDPPPVEPPLDDPPPVVPGEPPVTEPAAPAATPGAPPA